ncbi:hypothetical protein HIM_05097 [Hirsutella minnesotensis 3608]|uniref:Uncharacterized protein n=1 Tax=Hirsutella minnesotensis 3608 TaxID=1043627 RepID=A0A0F8A5N4_9HYPO|nr:hypothetical protein HIM_05097 [Hirsutella minnesotensis 3608]
MTKTSSAVSRVAREIEGIEGLFSEVTTATSQLAETTTKFLKDNPNHPDRHELALLIDKVFFDWYKAKSTIETVTSSLRALSRNAKLVEDAMSGI